MSNNWFLFKQFIVHQQNTAMKVGTDGILLGAWVNLKADQEGKLRILDVGTGTGLIALMIAQRSEAEIVAVEIDEDACVEAHSNFGLSPWNDRLKVLHADFMHLTIQELGSFDHIVCNPPYFNNSLQTNDVKRNLARHSDSLHPETLFGKSSRILSSSGSLSMIFPAESFNSYSRIAINNGLYLKRKTEIRSRPGEAVSRVLVEWIKIDQGVEQNNFSIHDKTGEKYSKEFINLTQNFYLAF